MKCKGYLDCLVCPNAKSFEPDFNVVLERSSNGVADTLTNRQWNEAAIRLICLASQKGLGSVLSNDEIMEFVWEGCSVSDSSLLQLVFRVRKHLSNSHIRIVNVRGLGYVFVDSSAKGGKLTLG